MITFALLTLWGLYILREMGVNFMFLDCAVCLRAELLATHAHTASDWLTDSAQGIISSAGSHANNNNNLQH